MSLQIIKAGVLDTIQDAGRFGYQQWGINPGGVMDRFAMQVANMLVGNAPGEAVIEMHFPAPVILFRQPVLVAISGADFSASLNGEPIPQLQPVAVSKNSILQFHHIQNGARAYLAVQGGFDLQPWLASRSTHLKACAGGYKGRALQKNDELGFRDIRDACTWLGKKEVMVLPWKANTQWDKSGDEGICFLPGREWDRLTEAAKAGFANGTFMLTTQSDRMGYRLSGEALRVQVQEELVSSAVGFGTIQLLPDGQLIILMADHQTTGGYPRVAHVISAHHSRLSQLRPGETIQFNSTDPLTAERLFRQQQQHLLQLQNACTFRLEEFFKTGYGHH